MRMLDSHRKKGKVVVHLNDEVESSDKEDKTEDP
jgi:hypothetical protein